MQDDDTEWLQGAVGLLTTPFIGKHFESLRINLDSFKSTLCPWRARQRRAAVRVGPSSRGCIQQRGVAASTEKPDRQTVRDGAARP